MSQVFSHEDIIDIIDILYVKIIRLKNSWDFISLFVFNGNMENHYPDLTFSLKYSFGIDAYTTIDALFSSGEYTFFTLKKRNDEFGEEYRKAKKSLKKVIPNIEWNRDKLFCHFVEKQSEQEIDEMLLQFHSVYKIMMDLHLKAMRIFDVGEHEIRSMSNEKFVKLREEKQRFSLLLMEGLFNETMKQMLEQ